MGPSCPCLSQLVITLIASTDCNERLNCLAKPMRVIKMIVGSVAIFLISGGLLLWWAGRKPARPEDKPVSGNNCFETWHARREAKNPPGLTMTLDTADGKRTYPESEYIPLLIKYSSSMFRKYNIETAIGSSAAGQSQRLHADGIRSLSQMGSFACCGSLPRILDSTPYVFTPRMRVRLVPGKHELYMTASQVFSRQPGAQTVGETTSTILWLDITPDPGWQQRELVKLQREYATEKRMECHELSSLDNPDATTEKLKLVKTDRCPMALTFRPSEYAIAVPRIERWIRKPNHAVTRTEFEALAASRLNKYPELADLDNPNKDYGNFWTTATNTVYSAVAHDVCTLPRKTATAQRSTNATVCNFFAGLVSDESLKATNCSCPAKPRTR